MLRIRDNSTVKELDIPKDVLEVLEKIQDSKTIMDETKVRLIKKLTNGSQCCICRGLPSHEVVYHLEGATQMERYCDSCIKKVYEREQVL